MLNFTKIPSIRAKGRKSLYAKCTVRYSPGNICYPSTHTTVSGERKGGKGLGLFIIYILSTLLWFPFPCVVLLPSEHCIGPLKPFRVWDSLLI